jgi:hypothetical protein
MVPVWSWVPWEIISDFTIVNYRRIINTLVSAKFPSSPDILSHGEMQIAAKTDTKSGYISLPFPYWVFTTVNRNKNHEHIPREYRKNRSSPGSIRTCCPFLSRPLAGKAGRAVERNPELRAVLLSHGADRDRHADDCTPQDPRTGRRRWYVSVNLMS